MQIRCPPPAHINMAQQTRRQKRRRGNKALAGYVVGARLTPRGAFKKPDSLYSALKRAYLVDERVERQRESPADCGIGIDP